MSRLPDRLDFIPIHKLSTGEAGFFNKGIWLVRCKQNGKTYIEKRIGKNCIRSGHAAREARAMAACNQPNLIAMFAANLDTCRLDYGSIYMQHCELGSLHDLLERFAQKRIGICEGFLWKVLWDVALALCYLQSGVDATQEAMNYRALSQRDKKRGWDAIMHRDIKPDNILLTWKGAETQYPTVVLADFGCSVVSSDVVSDEMTAFTKAFAAPEAPKYTETSDVYSLGLSVCCLAGLKDVPNRDYSGLRGDAAKLYGNHINYVLRKCLERDHRNRPSALELPSLVARENAKAREKIEERSKGGNIRREKLPDWAFA
ncbi:hypothetical protein N0V90_008590 [Kalmusia sp. IMI 367209]|nr:hypothetical protein N0V90_008590 [Kalmusia sp. IMI 367209]